MPAAFDRRLVGRWAPPHGCVGRDKESKDAALSKQPDRLRAILGRATTSLRVGAKTARGDKQLQIENWLNGAKGLHSICNLRFAILLLQFFFALGAAAQVEMPRQDIAAPIQISGQAGNSWRLGSYEVWILRGNCVIQQGQMAARCGEAVLWIDRAPTGDAQPHKMIAYLENDVQIAWDANPDSPHLKDRAWFGRFFTAAAITVHADAASGKPDVLPPIYQRGMERRNPMVNDEGVRLPQDNLQLLPQPGQPSPQNQDAVQPAQYVQQSPSSGSTASNPVFYAAGAGPAAKPGDPKPAPSQPAAPPQTAGGTRRLHVYPRSDVPVQAKWFSDPRTHQQVAVIDSGVNVIVENVSVQNMPLGTIDILTDRLIIWTNGDQTPDLQNGPSQDNRAPLEFYMEGNIVFRQGSRTIYANRMYFDVPNNVGTIINAELLTPVKNYDGLLRLHADIIRQSGADHFVAENSFVTSSRLGVPGYRLQSSQIDLHDAEHPKTDVFGQPVLDPNTGAPEYDHQRMATANNNLLFIGSLPIFYWPTMTADLNDSTYYLRRVRLREDNVYGYQVLTNWSGYELLGIRDKPVGTDLDVNLDYLNKRGFGYGATFTYDRGDFFVLPGHSAGLASYYGIQDQGLDNLGQGRMNLEPEKDYRYRLFWNHREDLPFDFQMSAELGWISDRNFLEEYYKSEWDEMKDESTGVELKRLYENQSLSFSADYGLNEFFTHTNWLPRADHFWLGQSLLDDHLLWYEHSSAAYAQFDKLQPPTNINDQPFNYLPWEANSRAGERFVSTNEVDWPFQAGPVKVVPFAMGQAGHWGEDINGEPIERLWGQVGVRASIPFWRLDPTVESELLNVHGIMNKIIIDGQFSAAQANRDMTDFPLYDAIDDDSIEAFRRHYLTNTFGIPSYSPLPYPSGSPWVAKFDERYYALRYGLQDWVTSPSAEIADDLMVARLGYHERWQTKRGSPDHMHTIDWITFDTNISIYPDADRDNYGSTFGLWDYDFTWHVGDKLTMVSDGIFDFFDEGQKIVSIGGFLSRPPRGSLYAGLRLLQGPMDAKILTVSYTYLMSPKWATTLGTSIDFGAQASYAQTFSLTHIGESFLINFGFTVDPARDSVGVALAVEPRFLNKSRLGNVSGVQIPPAGAMGLE
jgi:hypothetical protein